MKKTFKALLFLMIASLILPFGGQSILADAKTYDANLIENGTYDITAKALNNESDKASGAAGFINEAAKLSIKDGSVKLAITVPNIELAEIKSMKIEGKEPKIKKSDKENVMTFTLSKLNSELNADVHYLVPSMNMDHEVPFRFILEGLEDLPAKAEEPESDESEDEPDSDETTEPEKKPETDDSVISIDKGHYTINTGYLKDDSDDASSMGSYLGESAFLDVKDGKVFVTLTVNGDETVTKLQVNGKDAIEKKVDGDKRYETFEVDSLDSKIAAYAEYQAPYEGGVYEGKADFRVAFAADSVSKAKASDKPGYVKTEKPDADKDKDKDKDSNKPGNNSDKDESGNKDDGKTDKQDKVNLVPDKAYEIDYVIKHGSKDETSAADSFFKKPAHLFYKDGEKYIQLTVTSSDMIDQLKTAHGEVVIVKKNSDGSMVIQFKVSGNLSDAILLDMHITVPGMYSMKHDARLFLDESSLKEVDASQFLLVASDNGNGPTVEGVETGETVGNGEKGESGNGSKAIDDATPEKPEFGTNGDKAPAASKDGKALNPQTGDTSGILMYALLLLGSLIPLTMKLRRRFN